MRKKIIVGNWKMNKTFEEAKKLMIYLNSFINKHEINCEIVIAPPFLYLNKAIQIFSSKRIKISAQNMSEHLEGPYTGEISVKMLSSIDVSYVLLGHSERRQFFGENDKILEKKVKLALKYGIIPIYCCGELLSDREDGKAYEVNQKQIETALFNLNSEEISKVIIAYEPIWAIGTGKTASPIQAQEIHSFIRNLVKKKYSNKISNSISILYGGSLNFRNADKIFSQLDVDGGLIGTSSLKYKDFTHILKIFN